MEREGHSLPAGTVMADLFDSLDEAATMLTLFITKLSVLVIVRIVLRNFPEKHHINNGLIIIPIIIIINVIMISVRMP